MQSGGSATLHTAALSFRKNESGSHPGYKRLEWPLVLLDLTAAREQSRHTADWHISSGGKGNHAKARRGWCGPGGMYLKGNAAADPHHNEWGDKPSIQLPESPTKVMVGLGEGGRHQWGLPPCYDEEDLAQ